MYVYVSKQTFYCLCIAVYGPTPIADTALTCTPYEGTSLLCSATVSVVALTGPCQERLAV